MGSKRELKMKNLKLKITSSFLSTHPDPECWEEGSANLISCVDSSLPLRMTPIFYFEFIIREAL